MLSSRPIWIVPAVTPPRIVLVISSALAVVTTPTEVPVVRGLNHMVPVVVKVAEARLSVLATSVMLPLCEPLPTVNALVLISSDELTPEPDPVRVIAPLVEEMVAPVPVLMPRAEETPTPVPVISMLPVVLVMLPVIYTPLPNEFPVRLLPVMTMLPPVPVAEIMLVLASCTPVFVSPVPAPVPVMVSKPVATDAVALPVRI